MRIDDAGGSKKSRVRDSPDSRIAVVVRDIFQQPFEGVVEIAGIIHVFVGLLVIDVWAHLDERALRHVAAANILKNENISSFVEVWRRTELSAVLVYAIRTDAVGRTVDEKWVAVGTIFGNVNRREQMHAISHRDAKFVFCVMLFDVEL